MNRRILTVAAASLVPLLAGGCTRYYQVSDVSSGKSYYTTKVDRERTGAVRFTDDRTKGEITLQSSEIVEVTKDQYQAGVKSGAPAPAPKK